MIKTISPTGAAVTAVDFSDIGWRGNWIWCDASQPSRGRPGMEPAETNRPEVHTLYWEEHFEIAVNLNNLANVRNARATPRGL